AVRAREHRALPAAPGERAHGAGPGRRPGRLRALAGGRVRPPRAPGHVNRDRRGATALTPTRGRRQDSDRRGATALTPTRGRRQDSDRRGATALTPTRGRRQVCRLLTEASARTSCGSSFVWRSSTVQAKGMLLI